MLLDLSSLNFLSLERQKHNPQASEPLYNVTIGCTLNKFFYSALKA